MANTKISDLTALSAAPATGDLFPIVDVSDTTHAASGTTKKITLANLFTSPTLTTPVIGAATGTSLQLSGLTASEILATDASKNLVSLAVATYPSLTELAYVKGVTSAIQTQLTAKAPSTSPTFATSITGSYLTASEMLITDGSKNIVSAAVATYPSLTELTYLKGVTSAIQTQIGTKVTSGGALGTPSSGTGTNITGIPVANILPGTLAAGTYLLAENASIGLDPAGSADGKYTGITVTGVGGTTIAFGDLIYLDPTDSRWELADANSAAAADGDARGILGIAVTTSSDGAAVTVLLQGIVRADAAFPAMTINAPLYVSETAGDITLTKPTTTDAVVRPVGFALTADELFFNPDPGYQTAI